LPAVVYEEQIKEWKEKVFQQLNPLFKSIQ